MNRTRLLLVSGRAEACARTQLMFMSLVIVTTNACATLTTPSVPAPKGPPPNYVPATRSEADCVGMVHAPDADRYASEALNHREEGYQIPAPKELFLPDPRLYSPNRGPAGNAIVSMRVDEKGFVVKDSVRMSGMARSAYTDALLSAARKTEFWPAVRDGCAVPGWYIITFSTPH